MAVGSSQRPCVSRSVLPDISKTEMYFYDTSFFQESSASVDQLPSPASILQQSPDAASGVIKFDRLKVVVKFGPSSFLRLEEAQTMRAIRLALPRDEVPVPEVFGWRQYEGQNFIYMSLVRGQTLQEAWSSLTESDKGLISSINGGFVQDRFFQSDFERGPFPSIQLFNDWVLSTATRQIPAPVHVEGLYRDFLPDDGNVYFTHGDLTLGNIIISSNPSSPRRIESIIDWEQAGWYPEYWEYFKLLYGVQYTHEWREAGWVDRIMKPFDNECIALSEYFSWRCP
nr:hypothetical protein CFP56_38967 [Quercus suber]